MISGVRSVAWNMDRLANTDLIRILDGRVGLLQVYKYNTLSVLKTGESSDDETSGHECVGDW